MFERGRTNFAQLQRRVTAGRRLLRLAHEYPAHYVLFDLLADAGGKLLRNLPLSERRARPGAALGRRRSRSLCSPRSG
ncbi:hypothetical protein [Micromonospora pisi]|uniref:hypothetical protein n=1 Tax=Micromonospora pisi TaxID=589240 RepID=UPI001B86E30C|nr:hypothetical protein [Micromonospora pisi]